MNVQIETKVGALFKLVVHKGDGVPVRETDWFHNLVLDSGLDRMGVGNFIYKCCVGTGNSTPVASQTALDSFLASTDTITSTSYSKNTTTLPYYMSNTARWRFGEGVAAGNISEVGMGWDDQNLWNRALIRDAQGNPTTITVLPDEFLDIIAEVRLYPSNGTTGSFNLLDKSGAVVSTHTWTAVPYMSGGYNLGQKFGIYTDSAWTVHYVSSASVGSVTDDLSGPRYQFYSQVITKPTSRSNQTVCTARLEDANMEHKSFKLTLNGSLGCDMKFEISPSITKTSSQVMTYTFTMSWDRYTP